MSFYYLFLTIIGVIVIGGAVYLFSNDGRPEMDGFGKRTHVLMDKDGNKYNVKWRGGQLYTVMPIEE